MRVLCTLHRTPVPMSPTSDRMGLIKPFSSVDSSNFVTLLLIFCVQINFFQDHTKVILCPLMGAVTFIDDTRESRTFRLSLIGQLGCGKALWSRLRYAQAMVRQMLNAKSSTDSARLNSGGSSDPQ